MVWLSDDCLCWQVAYKCNFWVYVVNFISSTLSVYCINSWFIYQKLKLYWMLRILCGLNNLSWFQRLKYIPPSFWPRVTKHAFLWEFLKSDSLAHCSFTNIFHYVIFFRQNLKYSWMSDKDSGMYNRTTTKKCIQSVSLSAVAINYHIKGIRNIQ